MTQKNRQFRGTILTLIGGTAWGFSGTCGQYIFANSSVSSGMLATMRMVGAGIILLLFCLVTKKGQTFALWKRPKTAAHLILFGVAGLMFSQYSYLTAISYSNSATATVFQNSGIIFVMIITCIAGRRLPRGKEVFAAVLALSGVFLLSTHGHLSGLVISENAFLWGMLEALAWVSYTLLPGKLLDRWGTPVVNGFGMLIGGIVMGFGIKVWEQSWIFDWNIMLAIAMMIIFGTVVAFTFYLQGVADIGPVKASMLACVEPLVATILSAVWLKTEFAVIDLLGFALIIGGCMIISMSREENPADEQETAER